MLVGARESILYDKPYTAELEWMQNKYGAHILTDIVPDYRYSYEVEWMKSPSVDYASYKQFNQGPLGNCVNPHGNQQFGDWLKEQEIPGLFWPYYGNDTTYRAKYLGSSAVTDWVVWRREKNKMYWNGSLMTTHNQSEWSCPGKMTLFGISFGANSDYKWYAMSQKDVEFQSNCRIKYAKIWCEDDLVGDFIPVRIGETGCMYDKVTKKIYVKRLANIGNGNGGSGNDWSDNSAKRAAGTFILGPDKVII